jgi:hypothetical protein
MGATKRGGVAGSDRLVGAAPPAAAEAVRSDAANRDTNWEAQLAKLKQYKRKRGDCNVPKRWTEDPGLGQWVAGQRKFKKWLDRGDPWPRMTAARAAKLEALGFAWELSVTEQQRKQRSKGSQETGSQVNSKESQDDAGWEDWVAKLVQYKRMHGDCIVPRRWVEDPPLGRWVCHQRKCKKKLDRGEPSEGMTAARAAKLEALGGFAWELAARRVDAGWEAQLAKLTAYKRKCGNCNVPQRWAEDMPLGRWVATQRQCKRQLDRGEPSKIMTAPRAAKLHALGFDWAPPRGGAAQTHIYDDV